MARCTTANADQEASVRFSVGSSQSTFRARLGVIRRSMVLAMAASALVIGGGFWFYYRTRPDQVLDRAREALSQGDRHRALALAARLERGGHVDYARFIRGENSMRLGRQAMTDAERVSAQFLVHEHLSFLARLGATVAGAPLAGGSSMQATVPASGRRTRLAEPWSEKARLFRDEACAAFFAAYDELGRVDEQSPLGFDASVMAAEALIRVKELGRPIPTQDAVNRLRRIIDRDPNRVDAHRWLALLYIDLNAVDLALKELDAVARLDPNDGRPLRMKGYLLKDFLKVGPAVEAYREALKRNLQPHVRAEVVEELGRLLIKDGKAKEALAVLDQCPPLFQGSARMLALRAEVLWNLRQFDEATRLVQSALRIDPDLRPALRLRARMYIDRDQPAKAIPFLKRLLTLEPYDHRSRHQLAILYQTLGDEKAAAEQLRLRERTHQIKLKLTDLSARAAQKPWDDELRVQIAEKWLEMGGTVEARMWLRAALLCNPRNEKARRLLRQLQQGARPKDRQARQMNQ